MDNDGIYTRCTRSHAAPRETSRLVTGCRTRAETAAWLASQVTELRSWLGFFFSTFPNRTAVFPMGTPSSRRNRPASHPSTSCPTYASHLRFRARYNRPANFSRCPSRRPLRKILALEGHSDSLLLDHSGGRWCSGSRGVRFQMSSGSSSWFAQIRKETPTSLC